MKYLFHILFLLVLNSNNYAQSGDAPYFCKDWMESLPIRQGGRVKPLIVQSKEMLRYITGKSSLGSYSSVVSYCLLSLESMGLKNQLDPKIKIDHPKVREFLDLGEEKNYSAREAIDNSEEIRIELMKQKEETSYKKSLQKLFNQTMLFKEVTEGNNWLVASGTRERIDWIPLTSFLTEQKVIETGKTQDDPFEYLFQKSKELYIKVEGDRYLTELTMVKLRLPHVAMLLSLLALAAMVLFKNFKFALGLSFLTVLTQTALITFRVLISGRAPITNMYETVMFSGFGALVLALIIGHFKKEKAYIFIGLAYNVMTLMMMNFATGMLNASISPLVPVLRDNFWLSTHVTTIILSYGALALSWVLANTVLIKKRFSVFTSKDEVYYADIIYTCLKYGTTLLAAGIILGGVWADYSWGRFWGWDPKETWSLIVLCLYMAILHGRYTNWIKIPRFAPLVALAFLSVMMAWFGVNYILASGLHSYGFSEGGAIFLGSFFIAQIAILLLTYKKSSMITAS